MKNLRIDRNIYAEDIIINPAVVEFYLSIEGQKQQTETVRMDIPAEYQNAVQKLLQKLMTEKQVHTIENSAIPKNNKISNHPDLEHLIVVYENQTGKEKSKGIVQNKNGIGFNKNDAPILTTIAEKYLECGYVSDDDFAVVSRLIRKYHVQWEK